MVKFVDDDVIESVPIEAIKMLAAAQGLNRREQDVGFGRTLLWGQSADIAFVVAASMMVIILWAMTVGSILPILLKRIGLDPAVMSAPFITTLVDATGLFFYFTIASMVLPQLRH